MTIIPSISWPTRDHWATWPAPPRQPRYPDGHIDLSPSALASSAEIDNLVRALQQLHETQSGIARRRVTEAIKALRKDEFPHVAEVPEAKRLLDPLWRRREDAHALYKQAWSQHRDARPVDDAAWAVELQRRVAIESEFAAAWTNRMRMEEEPSATAAASTGQLELLAESAPQAELDEARR